MRCCIRHLGGCVLRCNIRRRDVDLCVGLWLSRYIHLPQSMILRGVLNCAVALSAHARKLLRERVGLRDWALLFPRTKYVCAMGRPAYNCGRLLG